MVGENFTACGVEDCWLSCHVAGFLTESNFPVRGECNCRKDSQRLIKKVYRPTLPMSSHSTSTPKISVLVEES